MIAAKPLTMTVVCRICGDQFGMWRTHCPACGAHAPAIPARVLAETKSRRHPLAQRRPKADECTLCRRTKAKLRCPHCNELIHKECLRLHRADCLTFQMEREIEIKKLGMTS